MNNHRPEREIKVILERRPDGGIRASSEDLIGFVLSHRKGESVLEDIPAVIDGLLSGASCSRIMVNISSKISDMNEFESASLNNLVDGKGNIKLSA